MDRYNLLDDWVSRVLVDHPEIIKESGSPVEVYSQMYEIWLEDCQRSLKGIIVAAN